MKSSWAFYDSTGKLQGGGHGAWKFFDSAGILQQSVSGGGGAPTDADYLVKTAHASLSAERVVTDDTSIVWDWATAGQAKAQRAALTGDVTAAANSNTTTIANDAVSYAKMQNVSAASKLLGRGAAAGSGDVEEITLGTGLSMSGTTLSSSGSGAISVVTTLPGTPANGDAVLLRIGTTPFEFVLLVYDSTYAKWVSAQFNSPVSAADANVTATTTATNIAGSWSHIPNYKAFYDAGLRLQIAIQARIQGSVAGTDARIRGAIAETANNNTTITVTETLTGGTRTGGDTNFKQVIVDWQTFTTAPTLAHAMVLLQLICDTTATATVNIRAYQLRWASS